MNIKFQIGEKVILKRPDSTTHYPGFFTVYNVKIFKQATFYFLARGKNIDWIPCREESLVKLPDPSVLLKDLL